VSISIHQVAQRAGVSIATVSRTFNTPDAVHSDTRERVAKAARALRYAPNQSASTLRSRRSRTLGVVLPTLLNPVFAECLEGIAHASSEAGYAIVPYTTEYDLHKERRAVAWLRERCVEGVVLTVADAANSQLLDEITRAKLPYVLLYNRHDKRPCVSVNQTLAVRDAVVYLNKLGHSRIAMVTGLLSESDRAQQRFAGYVEGMKILGLPSRSAVEQPYMQASADAVTTLLSEEARPTALICSNDLLAMRAIRAASNLHIAVPTELSVVGFDGIALGAELTPALTSISQPNQVIGRKGIEWLLAGSTPKPLDSVTLAHELRLGETVAAYDSSLST
jgi:LacI family transcriptional regulator, repressor for deo operon, udp, cdd, tsx, nupC, and nupG